jgi:hypothetical protein
MTVEKVLYTAKARTTGSWKDIFMNHPLLRLVFLTLPAAQAAPTTVGAQVQAAPPISGVIGKVQSFTGSSLDVQTPSGVVHVEVKQPLTTYSSPARKLPANAATLGISEQKSGIAKFALDIGR